MWSPTPDLFDETPACSARGYADAFDAWLHSREQQGVIREPASAAVYGSMWMALTTWCVARGLALEHWRAEHLEAYLHARGGADELTPRYAWRLLTLADAVQAHHARATGQAPNAAARSLLVNHREWRYANSADKTPLPEHLNAAEARALVAWLLDPASAATPAGAPAQAWQSLRNRTAVALQLGGGLTPGDLRAATVDGVVCNDSGLAWKIRVPAHGGSAAREAPLAPWAGRLLRHWLATRSALRMAGPALFPATLGGRRWGKVAQYNAAKAVLAAAGVPDADGGSFKLRHTFALRQLRRGSAPEQVAQWLGLRSVATMARYRRVLLAPTEVV